MGDASQVIERPKNIIDMDNSPDDRPYFRKHGFVIIEIVIDD